MPFVSKLFSLRFAEPELHRQSVNRPPHDDRPPRRRSNTRAFSDGHRTGNWNQQTMASLRAVLLLLFSSAPLLPDAASPETKQTIAVVYRDFTAEHPDFGRTPGFPAALVEGCVWNSLSAAGKPVLRPECDTGYDKSKVYTNASNFAMWYADSTPSINGVLEFIGEEKTVYTPSTGKTVSYCHPFPCPKAKRSLPGLLQQHRVVRATPLHRVPKRPTFKCSLLTTRVLPLSLTRSTGCTHLSGCVIFLTTTVERCDIRVRK